MRPLSECPGDTLRAIRGVFTDIDDTVSTDGALTARAYAALEALRDAGLLVVPITGRPAGWCDMIARFWPVDAVVGENGAFWFRYHRAAKRMERRFLQDDATRAANRRRLDALACRIPAEVPGAAVASDQFARACDLAIDFREDVPPLPRAAVDRIVALFEAAGATAKVSSIHVNGWFGDYDKLSMTRLMMRESFGVDLDADRAAYVFAGDSPNDAPMFGFFPNAVGVANVRAFADAMPALPAWVTGARAGDGFVELAETLLRTKS